MSFYEAFIQPIAQNQVVTGLSFTALLGAVGYQLRSIPALIERAARRAIVVSMTVTSADPTFVWIERWLAAQSYSQRAKDLTLRSYDEGGERAWRGDETTSWALSPGDGLHWFWWRRNFIWLHRSTEKASGNSGPQGRVTEVVKLHTFGRSQAVLRAIVADASSAAKLQAVVLVRLWRGYWAPVRGKRPRALETIVLTHGQSERIISALRIFEASSAAYAARGIPWRMGCLFKGPPGTGKTSFVLALAGHLNRPICVLNLGSVADDDALFSAVMDAPSDAIVLIEDIDCAGSSRARAAPQQASEAVEIPAANDDDADARGVTKAGLLNALDGITTPDGRIFVMTTNHPELLDAALIRPGRADVVEDFRYLGAAEQVRMAALYFPDGTFRPLGEPQSPAAMQAAFMQFPGDPAAARAVLSRGLSLAEAAD